MKAPEKLYITNDEKRFSDKCHSASTKKYVDDDIEYTRTDAFIEKACKFISDRVDIPFNMGCFKGEPLADSYIKYASSRLEAANKIIEDFKNYMKGE